MTQPAPEHIIDAEESLLSVILQHPAGITAATTAGVTASSFYRPAHALIFNACLTIAEAGSTPDLVTVGAHLAEHRQLKAAGGRPHIQTLAAGHGLITNTTRYAAAILEHAARRDLDTRLETALDHTRNGGLSSDERLELAAHLAGTTSTQRERRFRVMDTTAILNIPPPRWLIQDLIVAAAFNQISGPPDSYKSFLTMSWALHIAAGIPWHGRTVQQGPVVYVAAEGAGSASRRIRAWEEWSDCQLPTHPDLVWVPDPINLYDGAAVTEFADWLATLPIPPILIVFDTLARCVAGADENHARDMGLVVSNMRRICLQPRHGIDAAALPVHHSGHDEKQRRGRGSSVVRAANDCDIWIERPKGTELRATITHTRVKDWERPAPTDIILAHHADSLAIIRTETGTTRAEAEHAGKTGKAPAVSVDDVYEAIAHAGTITTPDLLGTVPNLTRSILMKMRWRLDRERGVTIGKAGRSTTWSVHNPDQDIPF